MLEIEVNKTDLANVRFMMAGIKNGVPRVITVSINKTIKTTQVQAVKIIGTDLNLPAKRIKADFTQSKANFQKQTGKLSASGDPVGLINFQARAVRKGVSHKVKKAAGRSTTLGAYISVGKPVRSPVGTQRTHIFRREYRRKHSPKAPIIGRNYAAMPKMYKSPTSRLTGPRIEDIYGNPIILGKVQKIAAETYVKNIGVETERVLKRYA